MPAGQHDWTVKMNDFNGLMWQKVCVCVRVFLDTLILTKDHMSLGHVPLLVFWGVSLCYQWVGKMVIQTAHLLITIREAQVMI